MSVRSEFRCKQWIAPMREGRMPTPAEFFEVERRTSGRAVLFLFDRNPNRAPPWFRERLRKRSCWPPGSSVAPPMARWQIVSIGRRFLSRLFLPDLPRGQKWGMWLSVSHWQQRERPPLVRNRQGAHMTSIMTDTLQTLPDVCNRIHGISTLPHIAMKVIEVANDPNAGARDMKAVLEVDAALSTRVLRCVVSSAYALRMKVTNLQQGHVLGDLANPNLALTASVSQLFRQGEKIGPYDRKGLWKHLVAVGDITQGDRDAIAAGPLRGCVSRRALARYRHGPRGRAHA